MRFSMSATLVPLFAVAAYAAPVVETIEVMDKRSVTGALAALAAAIVNVLANNITGAIANIQTALAELGAAI